MKATATLCAVIFLALACSAHSDYRVWDHGAWPNTWPKELEPLRKRSRTIVGGLLDLGTHEIPFTNRDGFESAWQYLLKVKSKGAPIVLVRSPLNHWHFGKISAGVLIQSPPPQSGNQAQPEEPKAGTTDLRIRWMWTNYIELVVDGKIVDLNRTPLPADTPIIDMRFTDKR
jgi:hypothetical protein